MAISFIGASAADGNTIAIPAHQPGDLIIIYSHRSALTAPTVGSGFTSITSSSNNGSSQRAGYRVARTNSETSGTWTNATGMAVWVGRNVSTNKAPAGGSADFIARGNITTSANYGGGLVVPYNSWQVAFGGVLSTTSTIESPPTGFTLRADVVGASAEYVVFDNSGPFPDGTTPGAISNLGASLDWKTIVVVVLAEEGLSNNYQFARVGDGMSVSERIR